MPTGPRGKQRMILEPVTIAAGVRLTRLKLPKLAHGPASGQRSTERAPSRHILGICHVCDHGNQCAPDTRGRRPSDVKIVGFATFASVTGQNLARERTERETSRRRAGTNMACAF